MKKSNLSLLSAPWFKSSLILLTFCALLGLLVSLIPFDDVLNKNWVDVHVRNSGVEGMFIFLLMGSVATLVGAPRQLVAFLGGYAFGFVDGVLLATLATSVSCALSFTFARQLGRPLVQKRFAKRIQRVNRFLQHEPLLKTIVIRLLPVGNNLITNLVAGVTHVRAMPFIVGSFVGYLPQMVIFSLMGKGIVVMSVWKIILSGVLFVVSAALSLRLYKQYKAARILEDESSETEVIVSP